MLVQPPTSSFVVNKASATDYGFRYQRQLTDPGGNILEFGYMDPVATEQGVIRVA